MAVDRPLTLPQLAGVAGVRYRTLHAWLQRGLLRPSFQSSTGTGIPNLFSVQDALAARILADLRRAGLDLDALERVAAELRERGGELQEHDVLSINGSVQILDESRRLRDALDRPEPALLYRVSWARAAIGALELR